MDELQQKLIEVTGLDWILNASSSNELKNLEVHQSIELNLWLANNYPYYCTSPRRRNLLLEHSFKTIRRRMLDDDE